jgi:hypothetical protein
LRAGIDAAGFVVVARSVRRTQLLGFFASPLRNDFGVSARRFIADVAETDATVDKKTLEYAICHIEIRHLYFSLLHSDR